MEPVSLGGKPRKRNGNGREVQIAAVEPGPGLIDVHTLLTLLKLVSEQGLEALCVISVHTRRAAR